VAEVVHLRVISDLTIEEIAEQLCVSRRTAQSDWSFGLAFLAERVNAQ
jgi:DNA-directed RNA polymerase specialized sigma24 family protein